MLKDVRVGFFSLHHVCSYYFQLLSTRVNWGSCCSLVPDSISRTTRSKCRARDSKSRSGCRCNCHPSHECESNFSSPRRVVPGAATQPGPGWEGGAIFEAAPLSPLPPLVGTQPARVASHTSSHNLSSPKIPLPRSMVAIFRRPSSPVLLLLMLSLCSRSSAAASSSSSSPGASRGLRQASPPSPTWWGPTTDFAGPPDAPPSPTPPPPAAAPPGTLQLGGLGTKLVAGSGPVQNELLYTGACGRLV